MRRLVVIVKTLFLKVATLLHEKILRIIAFEGDRKALNVSEESAFSYRRCFLYQGVRCFIYRNFMIGTQCEKVYLYAGATINLTFIGHLDGKCKLPKWCDML